MPPYRMSTNSSESFEPADVRQILHALMDGQLNLDHDDDASVNDKKTRRRKRNRKAPVLPKIDHPDFPSNAPQGHPHIIDIDKVEDGQKCLSQLTLADGILTCLYNYQKHTGDTTVLEKFFGRVDDAKGHVNGKGGSQFKYGECSFKSWSSFFIPCYLMRTGTEILAGLREPDSIGWEYQILYHIEDDGKWEPVGTHGMYTPENRNHDLKMIEHHGNMLAKHVIFSGRWAASDFTTVEYEVYAPFSEEDTESESDDNEDDWVDTDDDEDDQIAAAE
ncbi:hypothetical protein BT63DRAFT_413956 [Microthyrium microscopicum]|uniref:Uncharacterized protein n=1 Tax=Microthyrium microscopicum TaxID=703497 RepID=A0A6A6UEL8_9PEZI|nr:hypothetical protein BT63DRAFT_413956 [Microthyrium microscopicum]